MRTFRSKSKNAEKQNCSQSLAYECDQCNNKSAYLLLYLYVS